LPRAAAAIFLCKARWRQKRVQTRHISVAQFAIMMHHQNAHGCLKLKTNLHIDEIVLLHLLSALKMVRHRLVRACTWN
jgi:hypothetical protein